MPERFERVVKGICDANRATYTMNYEEIAPTVENDVQLTDFARRSLAGSIGADNVVETTAIMAAEDFAFFQRQSPACISSSALPTRTEGWTDYVHTPTFDPTSPRS